eukprot:829562-Pelagomonas_calceolata.AAC.1
MEYGFFSKPLNPTNPMFDYKTRTCDVTKYANSFVNNTGSRLQPDHTFVRTCASQTSMEKEIKMILVHAA